MTGTYTRIVSIIVPSVAQAGESVSIEVQIQSITSGGSIIVTATGRIDNTGIHFGGVSHNVPYGSTQSFYQNFIMPDRSVNIYVWSWVKLTDGSWHQDDSANIRVALEGAPPEEPLVTVEIVSLKAQVD